MNDSEISTSSEQAATEAKGLLPLLNTGQSIEDIRRLIGPGRRSVLRAFDILVLRLPKHPERQKKLRLRQKCNGRALPLELRNEIIALLRAGWSQKKILKKYRVGPGAVLRLSKEIHASFLKKGGRGRRFSQETWKQILAAVKTARTSREVERRFRIDYATVLKARREVGDHENRRLRLKITHAQIQQAEELLRGGESWRSTARLVGVGMTTLLKHAKYRKHGDDFAFIRLRRKKYDEIVAAVRAGKSRTRICRECHASTKTVARIRRTLAFAPQSQPSSIVQDRLHLRS